MSNEMTTDNMSNEEVIEVLKGIVFNGFDRTTAKERQALDLAIKALEDRQEGKWIPVSERLPEEKINPKTNDFEEVLCTTIWGDVRPYKFGKPIGTKEPHFWYGWGIMDKEIIAWQYKPEPYKEGGAE